MYYDLNYLSTCPKILPRMKYVYTNILFTNGILNMFKEIFNFKFVADI